MTVPFISHFCLYICVQYVVSYKHYYFILHSMSQSSQSSRAPRRRTSKSPISPDYQTTMEGSDQDSGGQSPIDDSGVDQDYIQPQEEEEESLEESGAEGDDDLKALLSNKSIPEKQRALMKQLIFERREQSSRSKQKKAAKKLQSERDSQNEQDSDADASTEQPSKKVPTQPNRKRKRSQATHSEQKKTSGQNPSKRQKSQVSFLEVDSESDSVIDVESMAKDVHSPSHLPKVGTKRRSPKPTVKSKSKSTSVRSVSPKQQTSSSGSKSSKPGPSKTRIEKPTEVSTPKQRKQNRQPSGSKSAFLQSPINTPTHNLDASHDPAATPVVYLSL